ncbi:MAG: hypothetical protein NC908_05015, partial [Candidatus Omnitrophica bacterium]|nr:hypothetical protein [Candidatus Omnitrophota bacterium]
QQAPQINPQVLSFPPVILDRLLEQIPIKTYIHYGKTRVKEKVARDDNYEYLLSIYFVAPLQFHLYLYFAQQKVI